MQILFKSIHEELKFVILKKNKNNNKHQSATLMSMLQAC